MADGQQAFGFRTTSVSRLRPGEIVVDLFAGGGGASIALEQSLGRSPDIAINHDRFAVGMHAANHPLTRHLCEDIWQADPRALCAGRRVGWLHASPDCTHFSQAKGGQPRSRATRSLSWVVSKWCGQARPRCFSLENVVQILKWGPLIAKRDRASGRVMKLDGTIAACGERVPVEQQFLIPDPRHTGRTWRHFIAALRRLGYALEWRALRACDYGAGTSRMRLFLIGRRDGEPIQWPAPTHGAGLQSFVTAADCIDWSIPCPSIFERKKPLADATCRRIARGIKRYVIDAAEPFIVPSRAQAQSTGVPHADSTWQDVHPQDHRIHVSGNGLRDLHQRLQPGAAESESRQGWQASRSELDRRTKIDGKEGCADRSRQFGRSRSGCGSPEAVVVAPIVTEHANSSRAASWRADEPLRTQCANVKGGHFALAAATLVQTGYGEREGQAARSLDLQQPLGTIVSGAVKHAPLVAFLEQANGGGPNGNPASARDSREPLSAITGTGSQQRVVTAHMAKLHGISHCAAVECTLSPEAESGALRVAAFLLRYYSEGGQWGDLRAPMDTITTRDRLALVTLHLRGVPYVIVDIGLRMLKPRELYRAQGFPTDYIIERTSDGTPLTISQQVRMVGNSVSPPPLRALAEANLDAVMAQAQAQAA